MNRNIFKKRLDSLRQGLTGKAPDTVWITQPENRRYLSGFRAADPQINESSGSLLINKKEAILLTDSRYNLEAEKEAPDFNVIMVTKEIAEELPPLLKRLKTKNLGFEENHLTWGLHRRLIKRLKNQKPSVRLTPLEDMINSMRVMKDRSEIRAMRKASNIMSEVLSEILAGLEPGATEIEIARDIERLAYKKGAEGLAFPSIVASGPNGALPHAVPTKRRIRGKEPVIFDVGVKLDGYCCDMTRTFFPEPPGPKFRKIYRIVREAQLAALDKIRPGIKSAELDQAARDIIKKAGFGEYFGHALGHGVGLAVHEAPRVGPKKPITIEEGMVFTIEPGIYLPGKGGVRLEEMVVVEKNGVEILTRNRDYYDF